MKSSYLRAGAALACALALSGCGGGDGDMLLGGYFYGVTKPGLVLTNNGGSDLEVTPNASGSGQFFFKDLVETDSGYNVQVKSKPINAEDCQVARNTGRVSFDITSVQVVCTIKKHELKGTITGLTGAGLVLVNGADKVEVPAGASSVTMAKVSEDANYGIVVLTQPANQTCTVANGTGVMGTNDVTNVTISCANT